jgi:hypothetical protein
MWRHVDGASYDSYLRDFRGQPSRHSRRKKECIEPLLAKPIVRAQLIAARQFVRD